MQEYSKVSEILERKPFLGAINLFPEKQGGYSGIFLSLNGAKGPHFYASLRWCLYPKVQ